MRSALAASLALSLAAASASGADVVVRPSPETVHFGG